MRTGWTAAGPGTRLGLLGLVIAVTAGLGTSLWLVDAAEARARPVSSSASIPPVEPPPAEAPAPVTSAADSSAAVREGRRFLALQDAWEARLAAKATRALAQVFPGRAWVTVNLELSPHSEFRSAVQPPPAGVEPNLLETRAAPAESGELHSDPGRVPAVSAFSSRLRRPAAGAVLRRQTDPSLYGRRTQVQLAPAIHRITASLVLDGRALAAVDDPAATRAAIVDVVKDAIGFDAARGDRMHPPVMAQAPIETAAAGAPGWVTWLMLGIVLVVTATAGWRVWRATAGTPAQRAGDATERMRREIESAIERDPDGVARILGEWATEGSA